MEHLRQLLIALVALTLVLSVASVANPNYFAGLNVYADHDEDEDDDNINSGSGKSDEEHDEEDDEDERDEDDDDEGDEDDDNSGKGSNNKSKDRDDDEDDDDKLVQTLGNHSKAVLEIDEGDLEVEIEDGDLEDGTYDVVFECTNPSIKKEFVHSLTVDGEEGEFEVELMLANGTYSGCKVDVGGLSATFSSFSIKPEEDRDEDEKEDDEEHDEEDNEHEDDDERNEKFKSKLKTEDEGVEIEVEVEGTNMTSGSYDAVFACEGPAFNVTLNDAFEVHNGKGKLKETIGLANGTYSGCDITVEGTVVTSFNTFTVSEGTEEEQERKVEVKRDERKQHIVSTTSGHEIHEKHRKANPASPGDYEPGWNYTLSTDGTSMGSDENSIVGPIANATVNIDMAVWKSTSAIILLDVVNGTIEVEDQQYTVKIGYAIYSTQHGAMKVAALAVDDDGNIVKLRLYGGAVEEGVHFPAESGSIDLIFEGSVHQSNDMFDWDLVLDGSVTAD